MPPENRFIAETTLRVRYAETDSMRIVHHSNYIVYFEEGRSEYARQKGTPYGSFEDSGFFLVVAEVGARYSKAAYYEQLITIRTWVSDMKSRGMTFNYEIVDAESGQVLVTGFTKHICITKDGKPTKMPKTWRAW